MRRDRMLGQCFVVSGEHFVLDHQEILVIHPRSTSGLSHALGAHNLLWNSLLHSWEMKTPTSSGVSKSHLLPQASSSSFNLRPMIGWMDHSSRSQITAGRVKSTYRMSFFAIVGRYSQIG